MTATNNITIGTISHGTLRPQDLIPAFLDAIQEYAPAHHPAQLQVDQEEGRVQSYLFQDDFGNWFYSLAH